MAHAAEPQRPDVLSCREAWFDAHPDLDPEKLIFIDETGTNSAMTPTYGKSLRGRRLYEARPVQRGRLYTIIGALSLGGLLTAMTMEGGTTTRVFAAFVEHLLCPHLRPGHVVVLDNLSAHKNLETRAQKKHKKRGFRRKKKEGNARGAFVRVESRKRSKRVLRGAHRSW